MFYYLISQILVLPLIIMNRISFKRFNDSKSMWFWHRMILVFTLLFPLLLIYKPVKSPVPESVVREVVVERFIQQELEVTEEVVEIKPIPYVLPNIDKHVGVEVYLLIVGVLLYLLTIIREGLYINKLKRVSIKKSKVDDITLYYINDVINPFAYGILKRSIFLPVNLTSKEEEIVLTHEMNHIRDNHLIWLNIEVFLKRLCWFNPIYIYMNKQGIELREYLCDEKSIQKHNLKSYGEILIRMTSKVSTKSRSLMVGLGKKTELKKRIIYMTKDRVESRSLFTRIKPVVVLVISIIISLSVPMQVIAETTVGFKSEFGADTAFETFTKLCRDKGTITAVNQMQKYRKEIIDSVPGDMEDYPFGSPVAELCRITLGWGVQTNPFTGEDYFHLGTDIARRRGTKILSSGNGVVISTGFQEKGYGYFIVIKHNNDFVSRYGQLDEILVEEGERVQIGDVIGKMGSSGRSTGPHLHYEVSYIIDLDASERISSALMRKHSINSGWFLEHIYNPN